MLNQTLYMLTLVNAQWSKIKNVLAIIPFIVTLNCIFYRAFHNFALLLCVHTGRCSVEKWQSIKNIE